MQRAGRPEPRGLGLMPAVLLCAALAAGPATAPPAGQALVPAGRVRLGSDAGAQAVGYALGSAAAWRGRWFDGERARTVLLPAFSIDRTLVTQAAYAEFVRATGHRAPFISAGEYRAQGFLVHPYTAVRRYLWPGGNPSAGRADHPVVLVSAPDGSAYCAWRGARQARLCRLPSEDEWEKAARGTDGRFFPWGFRWEPERLNTAEKGPSETTPVRHYRQGRSPFGVFDMAGNVFQWTATPGRARRRILKGCSWDDAPGICRAAARHDRKAESRHILIGFRCLCEVE